jgi:hypothetical protein
MAACRKIELTARRRCLSADGICLAISDRTSLDRRDEAETILFAVDTGRRAKRGSVAASP